MTFPPPRWPTACWPNPVIGAWRSAIRFCWRPIYNPPSVGESLAASDAINTPPARYWNTATVCRPTRRSIRAIRADLCTMPLARFWASSAGAVLKNAGESTSVSATRSQSTKPKTFWAICTAAESSTTRRWARRWRPIPTMESWLRTFWNRLTPTAVGCGMDRKFWRSMVGQ